MNDLVSVVIPAYNAVGYLKQTVNSVVSQTYPQLEIIIVNDGSKDHTLALAQELAATDARIKVLDQKNGGVSWARNQGYRLSRGRYLAFLDADDMLESRCIAAKVEYLQAKPEIGLVHTDMAIIDEEGKPTNEVLQGKEGRILEELLLWQGTCIPAPSSILVRREVLERVGLFDRELSTAADQEFFFRVASQYAIGRIAQPLGLYRIHGNNMHQNISLMEKDHIRAYRKAEQNRLFKSRSLKNRAYSNLYFILAGSWWVNKKNYFRSLYFLTCSIRRHPSALHKLLSKFSAPKV